MFGFLRASLLLGIVVVWVGGLMFTLPHQTTAAPFTPVQREVVVSWQQIDAGALLPLATTPTCDQSSDISTCEAAFLQPLQRPFGILVGIVLTLIGAICFISGLFSLLRGAAGGIFNEPRWVSRAMVGVGSAILIFILALVLFNVFSNVQGLIPAPCTPKLGGGCQ